MPKDTETVTGKLASDLKLETDGISKGKRT